MTTHPLFEKIHSMRLVLKEIHQLYIVDATKKSGPKVCRSTSPCDRLLAVRFELLLNQIQ